MLTPGQAHDLACAEPLIDNADPQALIGDKGYDADRFVEILAERRITPVIPPTANRKVTRPWITRSTASATSSNASSINSSTSAITTRYDKLARNFLAGVQLAAAMILLN